MQTRTWIFSSLIGLGLITTGACKKHDTDQAASDMKKAQDEVRDRSKDLAKVQEKDDQDVAKEQAKVDNAKIDLDKARTDYSTAVKSRLEKIDTKLATLSARTDAKSKDAEVRLKARRDALAAKLDAMNSQAQDHWDAYKKDVDDSFDSLDKDLDDATK
jgi:Skp family chaperone for outer membrane proteins